MSKPLNFIEITEMFNGDSPILHTIPLSSIDENGVVIGRDPSKSDICIGSKLKGSKIYVMLGRRHCTLYRQWNKDYNKHDYFLKRGYRESDGTWTKLNSDTGLDIFVAGKATDRFDPIELRVGALLEIVPRISKYQCKLHWGVTNSDPSQPPTIPVNENEIGKLQFENRILKEQAELKEYQLKELQSVNSRITEFFEKDKQEKTKLIRAIEVERKTNKSQDKKISHIRIYGLILIICGIILLGVDVEEIERIAEICALLAGGGIFYTSSLKE